MLVRIGESEKEPRFVNVRLVIVVIIQSISFDIHQNKCSEDCEFESSVHYGIFWDHLH